MSLSDHLDAHDIINSIRLQLRHESSTNKIWVLVEGEYDRLYKKLIDGEDVRIEVAYGGITNLHRAINELLKETDSVIGIRDADFIHLEKKQFTEKNIFLTDYHDIEMMIIACDVAFDAVYKEYDSNGINANALRDEILNIISFAGRLKWLNHTEKLELVFKNLGIGCFYNSEAKTFDEDAYIEIIMKRSPHKNRPVLKEEIKMKFINVNDYLNLCNGHDFHQIFAKQITDKSQRSVGHKEIAKSFRIAYRLDDFKSTNLYAKLIEWARRESRSLFKK